LGVVSARRYLIGLGIVVRAAARRAEARVGLVARPAFGLVAPPHPSHLVRMILIFS
jgi:hypothetical protein